MGAMLKVSSLMLQCDEHRTLEMKRLHFLSLCLNIRSLIDNKLAVFPPNSEHTRQLLRRT